jgi:tRNA modification GTPase
VDVGHFDDPREVTVRMSVTPTSDTICALSSAPGRAGIAVVRVSGSQAREVLAALAGPLPEPRRASLRTIRDPATGQEVDRGIVLFFSGPSSFTGEDVAEILLHGGRAVVASVLGVLRGLGCRLAEPGEFARRAFENGRIDLTEAEGIADLIDAETEAQRRQAVRQAGGELHRLYEGWRTELVTAMALTEASIDFSDEADVAADALGKARAMVAALEARIADHLKDGRRGEILRDGFMVVLAGPPNVGKSSLLNQLARRDAAIVSPEAGTTRDVIEVRLDLEGLPVIVSDTAGIREAGGEVEREGIRRTIARGREADLVLWLVDATAPVWEVPLALQEGGASIVLVVNKWDLVGAGVEQAAAPLPDPLPVSLRFHGEREMVRVSAVNGTGIATLVGTIAGIAREKIEPGEAPVITQARHREALEDCVRCLQDHLAHDLLAAELAAEDLRRAASALGRITGKVDAEQVLDLIFSRFCIGK